MLARAWRLATGHRFGLGAILLATALSTVAMTDGFTHLIAPDSVITNYYDALGDSLLHGRFDVPRDAIDHEAYFLNGKIYGYFGPTPALLRLPLNALFPEMRGLWTRPLMVLYCLLTLLASYAILRMARGTTPAEDERQNPVLPYSDAAFILCAMLGTPLLFIMKLPFVYHEAICAGTAFAMTTYALLLHYRKDRRLWILLAALACAMLSFQARGSVGSGPLLAVLLVGVSLFAARAWRHAVTVSILGSLLVGAALYKNVVVFHTLSGFPSTQNYVQMAADPARFKRTNGQFIRVINVPTTLLNYLDPTAVRLQPFFPYFFTRYAKEPFSGVELDWKEPFTSLTAVNPLWCVLAALGLWRAFARRAFLEFRIPLLGAAAATGTMLMAGCVTERYLQDAFPLLIIAGVVAYQSLITAYGRSVATRRALPWLLILAGYTCVANAATWLH